MAHLKILAIGVVFFLFGALVILSFFLPIITVGWLFGSDAAVIAAMVEFTLLLCYGLGFLYHITKNNPR